MEDLKSVDDLSEELWPGSADDGERGHAGHQVDRADVERPLECYQLIQYHPVARWRKFKSQFKKYREE